MKHSFKKIAGQGVKMAIVKFKLCFLIRYCWKRSLSTRDAQRDICHAEDEDTVSHMTVSRWYKRFQFGDMSLKDEPCSGRLSKLDDEIRMLADQ